MTYCTEKTFVQKPWSEDQNTFFMFFNITVSDTRHGVQIKQKTGKKKQKKTVSSI